MNNDQYIFKTKPSARLFVWGIIGLAFFCWLVYLLLWQGPGVEQSKMTMGHIAYIGLIVIFGMVAVMCLWVIISFQQCYLTANELIIVKPLLSYRRSIRITDIAAISGEDYQIKVHGRNSTLFEEDNEENKMPVYSGRKIMIKLNDNSVILLKSFEVPGCQTLADEIRKQRKNLKWQQAHQKDQ
ncbi:hypothetical protein ACFGVR_06300 [Mucilaginibacter sp. AW1-3]